MGGAKRPAKQQQQKQAGGKGSAAAAPAAAAKSKAGKKKQTTGSSGGYDSLRDPLDRQLALLGLRVVNITADGNCFFRALSNQLQGDEARHSELRAQVCALMASRPDDFAPFVEDDQSLDAYLARMRKEGVWAGHMELQAASLLLESNIAVYQAGQPRWCITNFPAGSAPMLHLSYHDQEHYNSVRRADDYSRGSPADIPPDLTPVADVAQAQESWSAADERLVAQSTGCDNPVLIRQQLLKSGGDVAAAIEAVIEVMAADDYEHDESAAAANPGTEAGSAGEGAPAAAAGSSSSRQVEEQAVPEVGQAAAPVAAAAAQDTEAPPVADRSGSAAEHQQEDRGTCSSSSFAVDDAGQQQQQQPVEPADSPAAAGAVSGAPPKAASQGGGKAKGVRLKAGGSSSSGVAVRRGGSDTKVSRNKPCPCGSGRKHKSCCERTKSGAKSAGSKAVADAAGADGLPAALSTLHI